MPAPKKNGIIITKEKIWSKNAGRTAGGKMVGDIVAYKMKLQITWPPLNRTQAALIDSAVSPSFFSVTFTNPAQNSRTTKTFYAGTPSYPVYSYVDGVKTYNGITVDIIEQ